MLSTRTFPATLLCLLLLCGCVPEPRTYTKQQLLGEYRIQYSFGVDTLILDANNTYEQHFTDTSGKTYTHRGKWDFEGG